MEGVLPPTEIDTSEDGRWGLVWLRVAGNVAVCYLPREDARLAYEQRHRLATFARERVRAVLITEADITSGRAVRWIAWALWGREWEPRAARAKYPRRRGAA